MPMSVNSKTSQEVYPVRLVDHRNTTCTILYDVEGNILTNKKGIMLNVYRHEMTQAFKDGDIKLFRNSVMKNICYRYFTTSRKQKVNFWYERKYGTTEGPNKAFHVYVDEDVDRSTPQYRRLFRLSREID